MHTTNRRHLLFPAMGLALLSCIIDLRLSIETVAAVGYVSAVILSLWSTKTWHSTVATALCLALLMVPSLMALPGTHSYADHSMLALLVVLICGVGRYQLKRTRRESMQLMLAEQARKESEQLRTALSRAEAAEAQYREALHRLTIATQTGGISTWEWDLTTHELRSDEGSALNERLGGRRTISISEYIAQYVHPDDFLGLKAILLPAAVASREEELVTHRYRCLRQDGSTRHVQIHARLFRDLQGKPVRYLGVEWDITREVESAERLERQADELQDMRRRLERASVSSMEGHWEVDLIKRSTWVSSSLQQLFGYAPEMLAGDPDNLAELIHPQEREACQTLFAQHLADPSVAFDITVRHRMPQGDYRWFRMRGAAERDGNGVPIRAAGSIHDVHEQKLAENALREVQARFERAIHGTQDGLWEADREADQMWLSPRAHELLGYAKGELGNHLAVMRELVHPDDLTYTDATVAASIQDRRGLDMECRMRRKDGVYRWFRLRGTPTDRTALSKGFRSAGSLQDVTEAREAREALIRATEAAKAASHAKTTFLATMSHEIRTPMNGIIGMTGLLLDSELDRHQREYADAIRSSAHSLLVVINDILDFSKIEAGRIDVEVIEMDLRGNVEDVGSMLALQAAAKNLELIVDVKPEVPQMVLGDPQRIRQCLMNLAGNAIKFTASGEIVIEVAVCGDRDGRSLVRFSVRDTGIGIDSATLPKLFDPFTQADSSTTRRFGGTGLGLSIVKRLAELMGGVVDVESAPGAGSTFSFTLPLKAVEPSGRHALPGVKFSGRRILVVDDNDTNRRVVADQLKQNAFQGETAANAAEGLQRMKRAVAENRPFDAVLVDFHMPQIDGAEFGEMINGDPVLSRSRLVLLTSLDSKGDHARFAAMGFAAYLTKPVRSSELRDCLERVLARDAQEWHAGTHPLITRGVLASVTTAQAGRGRVLVVEDNIVNQKVAQKFLERLGFSVLVVDDGSKAVPAFENERFDIIFMDMQMPIMDGVTATREIRKRESIAGTRTPIIALTANVLSSHFQSCLEAGMDDVLAKPIDIARLRDLLDRFAPGRAGSESAGTARAGEITADLPRRAS
jgi:two-component system, sensor histidine kinase and response regulator